MRVISLALSLWLIVSSTAPVAATPAAEAEPAGALSIVSEPAGALAYVDGRAIGQTPVDIPLAAGDHRVRLVKGGYLENGRIVTIVRGRTQKVEVRLTADATPSSGSGAQVSGGSGGSSKKWLYIGIAGGAAAVAVVALAGGNSAPAVGNIVVSPTTGLAASTIVRFSATATDKNNDPITFAWDFGDGATSTGAETTHTFANAGTFTVKVTANDGKASGTNQTTVTIRNVAGTWRSNPVPYIFNGVPQGNMQWVFTITQSLAILNGSLQASGAIPQLSSAGTVTGLVGTGTPAITLNGSVPGWQPPTFTLDPNTDITTLTGRWIDAGGTSAITFTRQ